MAHPANSLLPTLVLVPLVGFALYRRLKGSFGRQPVVMARMIFRSVLFLGICGFLLAASPDPSARLAAAAGLFAGVGLALVGLRHTTVETTHGGTFYTPNKWLGLVVTALVVGRIAARLIASAAQGNGDAGMGDGRAIPQVPPLTLGLLCLMAGYYVAYYAGVLRKARGAAAEGVEAAR